MLCPSLRIDEAAVEKAERAGREQKLPKDETDLLPGRAYHNGDRRRKAIGPDGFASRTHAENRTCCRTHSLYLTMLGRALRLRCPRCGRRNVVFGLVPHAVAVRLVRADLRARAGFFLGSIYVNYGLTALLTTVAYIALFATDAVSASNELLWGLTAFCSCFRPGSFAMRAACGWDSTSIGIRGPKDKD